MGRSSRRPEADDDGLHKQKRSAPTGSPAGCRRTWQKQMRTSEQARSKVSASIDSRQSSWWVAEFLWLVT